MSARRLGKSAGQGRLPTSRRNPAPRVPRRGSPSPKLPVTKGLVCWFDAAVGVIADDKGDVQDLERPVRQGPSRQDRRRHAAGACVQPDRLPSRRSSSARAGLPSTATFFAKEHYLVIRSPGPQWSGAGGLLGRLKGRGSSYNTWANDTGFWQDQSPGGRFQEWNRAAGTGVRLLAADGVHDPQDHRERPRRDRGGLRDRQ